MRYPVSLYLHIPFCTTKCTYCAFNTYTRMENLIEPFVDALCREITMVAQSAPSRLTLGTIFFGGGTPSLLTPEQFKRILDVVYAHFDIVPDLELSIEANPNDLDELYLTALRQLGINRLSIGMQSAVEDELKLFARRHDHAAVSKAVPAARAAGFDNLNLDLIYGVPYQTLASWGTTLEEAIKFNPEHISLYALGLEDGTPLKEWVEAGTLPTPDDDLAADMYELASEMLGEAGYEQYEISNWSKPGYQCRHNLQYWRNHDYIGVGPGAHGFAGGVRYATILNPQRYIKAIQDGEEQTFDYPRTPATVDDVLVDRETEIAETLIMWLRLTQEGVSREAFKQRFGVDLVDYHHDTITKYQNFGLLSVDDERVKLTKEGRLLSNMIFRELV